MAQCIDVPPDPDGRWNAKDHLAHLAWWRNRNASLMDAVRTGGRLPPSVEDDPQNALIYNEYRDRTAADIKSEARASWDRLEAALQACTEDDLDRPHPYAPDFKLWATIPGNGHGHLGQHLMFWYLDNSDEARAEAAQLWVRDIEQATLSDPEDQAGATYNLACFYGRVGRVAEALPLLRASLQDRPSLRELARKDPDLDRIRGDARVKELLAT